MEGFWNDITELIAGYYDELVVLVPRLVFALLVLLFTFYFSGMLSRWLSSRLWKNADDPLLAGFLIRLGRWILVITGIVIAFSVLGLTNTVTQILAGAGITAFIIGFAFKDLGENFLAGILLAIKRPFRIGDTVETNGLSGKITGMSLRETTMKTVDGRDVYIPNGLILKTPLVNFTQDRLLRVECTIGIDYEGDISGATDTVLQALDDIPEILKEDHQPSVVIQQLTRGSAVLNVLIWIDTNSPASTVPAIRSATMKVLERSLTHAGYTVREIRTDQVL